MFQLIIGIALIATAAVLGFYGTQIARDGWAKVFVTPSIVIGLSRPYVVVAGVQLVLPDDRSQPVQVLFDLKNTGQTEAIGSMYDFTYYFSTDPRQQEFAYQKSQRTSFRLAPNEQWRGHFLPAFLLSNEKLKALNQGKARLFIYARGEYSDGAGNTYDLPFSRMYHPVVAGFLSVAPDDIVFK